MSDKITGTTRERREILYWLPVILLPVGNIIVAFLTSWEMNWRLWAFSLVGAACEELFFRFFLLRTIFLPRMKPVLAIILVSLLFAGMHLWNLRNGTAISDTMFQMAFAFCFSIWAGAVTWKTTWIIPFVAHVLLNATAVVENSWVSAAIGVIVLIDGIILMKGDERNEQAEK